MWQGNKNRIIQSNAWFIWLTDLVSLIKFAGLSFSRFQEPRSQLQSNHDCQTLWTVRYNRCFCVVLQGSQSRPTMGIGPLIPGWTSICFCSVCFNIHQNTTNMFTKLFLPCLMLTCFDQQLTLYPVHGLVVFPSFRPLFSSSSVLCFPSPLDVLFLSSWSFFSGWWYTYPSEKYESHIESSSKLLGKIKHVPNHQSDNTMLLSLCT